MRRTIFTTAIVTSILRWCAIVALKLSGWKVVGDTPEHGSYVLIAAPHTSNWDFLVMIGATLYRHTEVSWLGKDALFKGIMGPVSRWFSGVEIDRSKSNDVVSQIVERYNTEEKLVVVICPEGTRGNVGRWKTGFYHIAHNANVPVVLGFADYPSKTVGFGPAFVTTGDVEKDIVEIQAFYEGYRGKYGPSLHAET